MAMRELENDDSFEEDHMFGASDDDMQKEAVRFDKKGKKKTPVVIEISDDDKHKGAKTKKVVKAAPKSKASAKKGSAKKGDKSSPEVDFTISLSPELRRAKTIMPGAHLKLLDMPGAAVPKATRGQKSKDDNCKKKIVLAGSKRTTRGKQEKTHHDCHDKKYTATSKWNDIITDKELERIERQAHVDSFEHKSEFDLELEAYQEKMNSKSTAATSGEYSAPTHR